jgi:hypothetical protein
MDEVGRIKYIIKRHYIDSSKGMYGSKMLHEQERLLHRAAYLDSRV